MPHSEHPSRASSHMEREKLKQSSSSRPSSGSGTKSSSSNHAKRGDEESSISTKETVVSKGLQAVQALREIAGDRVRHAKCAPEFLEAIAHRDDQQVKFISGSEASSFFVKYLGGNLDADAFSPRSNKTAAESQAIVFAVTVWDYDRKCVDYYMTWRGNFKYNNLSEREINLLDDDFRRVARRIDKDYKQFRRAGSMASSASRHSHKSSKRDRSKSPSQPRKSRPPKVSPSSPKADLKQPAGIPETPVSATSSVISLPYLNMVRGVPRGNRLPLMVTNPDRLSMMSEVDVSLVDPDAPTESAMLESERGSPPIIAITPPDKNASTHLDPHGAASSGLTPLMKSSASIYSTESQSSRSSRSSQSDARDSPELKVAALQDPESEPTEFLIVLLGDKLHKEGLSWHGMERQSSARSQHRSFTKEKERVSPWIGPLAKADITPHQPHHKRKARENDSDSDGSYEEGSWKDSPVVPMKPFLESLGFIPSSDPSTVYSPAPPVIPLGYPLSPGSMVASPALSNMMQLSYAGSNSTPRMSLNMNGSYVPAWISHSHSVGSSAASRPASKVVPPMAYAASPYMRPAY